MFHSSLVRSMLIGFPILLFMRSAESQNLLTDPNFDSDAVGWHLTPGANWYALPSPGSVSSGSLRIGSSGEEFASQCVAVRPHQLYFFQGKVKHSLSDQGAKCSHTPFWYVLVQAFSGEDCDESHSARLVQYPIIESDYSESWRQASLSFLDLGEANHVYFALGVNCQDHSGTNTAYFDTLFFGEDLIFRDWLGG